MKAQFKAEKPSDIQMTMTLTMTLGEWQEVAANLKDAPLYGPGGKLLCGIRQMIRHGAEHFEPAEAEEINL